MKRLQKLLCALFGHNMYLVTEHDNGYSKWGHHKCSRCGYEEEFQSDYAIPAGQHWAN